jgi:hypothetical protein
MQNIALTLFCMALSVCFLFGLSNIFFVLVAHTSSDRRVATIFAISSLIAVAALIADGLSVSYGPQAAWTLFVCAMIGLNWLALRAILDARFADANPSE